MRGGSVILLDSPRWAELRHAYGPAADIPEALRAIAAAPAQSSPSGGPWFELWSSLCHQGDVYPASFAAVPHLVKTLSENVQTACYDFFLLPAAIEVARNRRGVAVPEELRLAYEGALARLPSLAAGTSTRPWDTTYCHSVLAAVAVGKGHHAVAELLMQVDDGDVPEVISWYMSR